jgi:hypothetical protein
MTTRQRPDAVAVREREARALSYRKGGATYAQIAQQLHVSEPRAYRIVQRALGRLVREPAQEYIDLEVARLEDLHRAMWPKAMQGNAHAVDRCLAIAKRRADLLGLDAPQKHDLNARMQAEVYSVDALTREIEQVERELAENDPEWAAGQQRRRDHEQQLQRFTARWSGPGEVRRNSADFIAEGLALLLDGLDLDDQQREGTVLEVESYLLGQVSR